MKYSLLSILLFLVSSLHAKNYSYTQGEVENGDFEIEKSIKRGPNYIDVTYHFSGFSVEKTIFDNNEYHLIHIKNTSQLEEKGCPQLPLINDMLSVASMNLKVEVKESAYREYKTFNIIPSRGNIIQSSYDSIVTLTFSDVYEKNALYPENSVKLSTIQSYRSYPFAYVNVYPIQYNPITKSIKCYTDITYRISWSNKDFISEGSLPGDEDMPLNYGKIPSILKGLVEDYVPVENSSDLRDGEAVLSKEFADYIIVTTDKYLPAVEKFKNWKTMLGYKCKVLSTEWTTPNEVDQAIKAAYISNEKPEYLLIVGDIDDVPSFMKESSYGVWASDLKYVCMDGPNDYTADMARGRISVKSLDEANVVFDKIIKYEKDPVIDDDFYTTLLHCAQFQDDQPDGYEDRRFVLTSEEIRNYMLGWGKKVNRVYKADQGANPEYYSKSYSNGAKLPSDLYGKSSIWNGGTNDVTAYINAGTSYVLHRDHGYYSGWGSPRFNVQNVNALTNGDKTPVVFSLNCQTGGFQQPICFCEAFLRHSNGGAVGIIGASQVSYSGLNDALAIGMFNSMYPNPGVSTVWAGGRTYKPADVEPTFNMGHVLDKGLLMMGKIYCSDTYTNEIFHYFGDPSMELRTEIPACLDATVEKKGTTVTVSTPVEGCRISLSSTDDAGETYVQSFDNVSEASFDDIDFDYTVTVYKHNYVPYVYDTKNGASINSSDAITYIQNKTYTSDENVKANIIEAGKSVTASKEEGDVLVDNVNVNFYAAKSIKLASGFTVSIKDENIAFVAKIDDNLGALCPYSPNAPISSYSEIQLEEPQFGNTNNSDDDIKIEAINLTDVNSLAANDIKAYVQDNEIIVVLGDLNANVVISDMSGKQIKSKQGNGTLRFSVNKGAYVVTVLNTNSSKSEKVIVE